MAGNHANTIGEKVKESLEMAQARLANLEEEAQRVVAASRKEVAHLFQRFNAQDLFERAHMKEWSGRARHVSEDMAHRLEDLRERVVTFVGVASREQVEDLARDLEKLARKGDKAFTATPGKRREPKKA